ncbi:50S ribosomal protein bL37 [Changpingibacter yushuensis]
MCSGTQSKEKHMSRRGRKRRTRAGKAANHGKRPNA